MSQGIKSENSDLSPLGPMRFLGMSQIVDTNICIYSKKKKKKPIKTT